MSDTQVDLQLLVQQAEELVDIEDKATKVAEVVEIVSARDYLLNKLVWRLKLKRLARQGVNPKEASRRLGLDYGVVRQLYAEPEFRREVIGEVEGAFAQVDEMFAEQQLSLGEKLEKAANVAFDKLYDYMTSDANNLTDVQKAKIAMDMLDRHQESSKVNRSVQVNPRVVSEDLVRAAQAAREMDKIRSIA